MMRFKGVLKLGNLRYEKAFHYSQDRAFGRFGLQMLRSNHEFANSKTIDSTNSKFFSRISANSDGTGELRVNQLLSRAIRSLFCEHGFLTFSTLFSGVE